MAYSNVKKWLFNRNFNALYLQRGHVLSLCHPKRFCKKSYSRKWSFFEFCMASKVSVSALKGQIPKWTQPALWWLLEPKIMIIHILINHWLDFHVVKILWKYIKLLIWKLMSNVVLRFFFVQYTTKGMKMCCDKVCCSYLVRILPKWSVYVIVLLHWPRYEHLPL